MSNIKVIPLVWKSAAIYETDTSALDHYAVFRGGWLYLIKQRSHGIYLYKSKDPLAGSIYPSEGTTAGGVPFKTLQEAKDSAQTEFESFIREAIQG